MRVLVACEYSGRVRDAFIRKGHDAISCDLLPSDSDFGPHYQGDVRNILKGMPLGTYNGNKFSDLSSFDQEMVNEGIIDEDLQPWDLLIAHPPCTRLANSGVRWLHERNLWDEMKEAADFYLMLRNAPIEKKCIENPIMHKHAKDLLGDFDRQVVQPWWFGEETFKATGYELHGLDPLQKTNVLTPPKAGTKQHKVWSWVHRCPPGPMRWKIRSTTPQGIANAMAEQWG